MCVRGRGGVDRVDVCCFVLLGEYVRLAGLLDRLSGSGLSRRKSPRDVSRLACLWLVCFPAASEVLVRVQLCLAVLSWVMGALW